MRNSILLTRMLGFLGLAVMSTAVSHQAVAAYDESKFCKSGADVIVILIDVTSEFDNHSINIFRDGVSNIIAKLDGGERVLIETIGDSFTKSEKLYDGCVPFCVSSWNIFSDCTTGLVKLRSREQLNKIAAVLRSRLSKTTDLPHSDIVRTLAYVVGPLARGTHEIKLYMFSDMIENSSFLPGKMFFSRPINNLIQYISENSLIPNFKRVDIHAFGVGRAGTTGRKPLPQHLMNRIIEFWSVYFRHSGAEKFDINETLETE